MLHVIGEILVDVFQSESTRDVFPGGAPYNVASNVSHFGGEVSFYGSVGKDENGKFLAKDAKKKNFSPLLLVKQKNYSTTQALVTLQNGERSFKFIRANGADYVLRVSNLKKLNIQKDDIVHLGSLMLSEPRGRRFFYQAIQEVKNIGAKLSFDINYRDDIFASPTVARRIFKKAIKHFDFVKVSDEEIFILSGKKRLLSGLKSLFNESQKVYVSLGKNGSMVYQNGQSIHVDTIPVQPVDTTGAGDAFYSYVLYSLISKQTNEQEMLRRANAVGAIATLKKGAIGVVPTLDELENYLLNN